MLGIMAEEMNSLNIPYEYMRFSSAVDNRYWIGEYLETPTTTEDGYKESTFILTGTTHNSWLELEQDKEKIESHFPAVYGLRKSTQNGSVAIFYQNSTPVDTGLADLKRIQVNLLIKQWKGAI